MSMRTIDSHLHVWDASTGGYGWLAHVDPALRRSFTAAEAGAELAASGIDGAVLVQADDTEADTDHMLDEARRNPWVLAVVGWVQLDDPARAQAQLERRSDEAVFRGIRHLVHDDARADFLDLASVRRSLALVARHGLVFEVPNAWPRHLDQVERVAAALPELTVIVDHLAKPPLGTADMDAWAGTMRAVAAHPNTVAKVSGLRLSGCRYDVPTLQPAWDLALDLFGPARLMYGGDWPMTVPDGGYGPTFAVLEGLIGQLSPAEQALLRAGTAERVYAIAAADERRDDAC